MHSEIAQQIRGIVSKKKKRYQKQGFDLDLSYVTDRIIAMGFPADKFEAIYRNYIDDVSRFFELNHGGKYKIYNLCRERDFDVSKFSGVIVRYPFDDHNPPAFGVLKCCIEDIGAFLNCDPENVVAINCKAGKGRTGVIVCCSMLYSRVSADATKALLEYGRSRTYNGKGVTIPSQIRYIFYYDHFLKNNLSYTRTPLWLKLIKFDIIPNINNSELQFAIYQFDSLSKLYQSKTYKFSKQNRVIIFHEMLTFPLYDDLRFEFIQRSIIGAPMALCHCWLNTFFVVNKPRIQKLDLVSRSLEVKGSPKPFGRQQTLNFDNNQTKEDFEMNFDFTDVSLEKETVYKVTLTKQEIDKANKDVGCRIFPANFEISFLFSDTAPEVNMRRKYSDVSRKVGNSSFFDSFPKYGTETVIMPLETTWKSTSSQFYYTDD